MFWSWLMLSSSPSWHQETKLNSAKSISHQNLFHISASLIPFVGGNFWRCQFWHTSFTLQQQFFEKQYKNLTTTKNTKNTIQGDFFNWFRPKSSKCWRWQKSQPKNNENTMKILQLYNNRNLCKSYQLSFKNLFFLIHSGWSFSLYWCPLPPLPPQAIPGQTSSFTPLLSAGLIPNLIFSSPKRHNCWSFLAQIFFSELLRVWSGACAALGGGRAGAQPQRVLQPLQRLLLWLHQGEREGESNFEFSKLGDSLRERVCQ